jgi:O-acetyl-ADP-ribose deacetylase (regulator of RNase III)
MSENRFRINKSFLELIQGDITNQDTQAVVNAANSRLAPGGGVAGAIHRAAGPGLWQECKTLGGCTTGQAKITTAYNLPNKYVIHTVGPIYSGTEDDAAMLKNSYINSLKLAEENKVKSVAFPAISTGAFGYPQHEAGSIALKCISEYLAGKTDIELVRLVLYDSASLAIHKDILKKITK